MSNKLCVIEYELEEITAMEAFKLLGEEKEVIFEYKTYKEQPPIIYPDEKILIGWKEITEKEKIKFSDNKKDILHKINGNWIKGFFLLNKDVKFYKEV